MLGRRIGAQIGIAAKSPDRRDGDDPAPAAIQHPVDDVPGHVEGAVQVSGHDRLPVLFWHLFQRAITRDTGAVDQYVDPLGTQRFAVLTKIKPALVGADIGDDINMRIAVEVAHQFFELLFVTRHQPFVGPRCRLRRPLGLQSRGKGHVLEAAAAEVLPQVVVAFAVAHVGPAQHEEVEVSVVVEVPGHGGGAGVRVAGPPGSPHPASGPDNAHRKPMLMALPVG